MSKIAQIRPIERPEPHKDRRVRRSRRLLREAMLDLLIEKGYENVTISDLAEQADLNRATFYLHYGSKEELLVDSLESQFDELVAQMDVSTSDRPPWDKVMVEDLARIFEYVAAHSELYKALLGDHGIGYVSQRIIDYIAAVDEAQLRRSIPEGIELPMPIEMMARHIAGSFYANIAWWVTNDMPHTPLFMAEKVHQLCLNGVFGALLPLMQAPPETEKERTLAAD